MLNPKNIHFLLFCSLLFLLSLASCNNKQDSTVLTALVEKTDFIDKITVSGTIESLKTTSISCPRINTDATILYLITDGSEVEKGDTLCILEASDISTKYDNALKDLEVARAEKEKAVASMELEYLVLKAKVDEIETTTAISLLDSTQMEFSSEVNKEIIRLQLEMAREEKKMINQKLKFLKRINQSKVQKLDLKIKRQENNLQRNKEMLDKLIIISPEKGMIVYAKLWTSGLKVREGDIVWNNMPIFQIPDMSNMQVKLLVSESSYKRVQKEQKVIYKIDAFKDIELSGKIIKKAPVGVPVAKDSKVKYFEITSSIDSTDFSIQPGLSVNCDIIIREFSDTLVIPQIAVYTTDSGSFAYILEGGKFLYKPVKIGYFNNNKAVVDSGLVGGEILALYKPKESLIKIIK